MKSGIVKSLGCAWLLLSVAATAVAGCGKVADEGELGGETHWLKKCSETSECGGALECLCGVCTATCSDDARCGAITEDARCVGRGSTTFAADCSAAAPARICVDAPSVTEPGTGGTSGSGSGGTGGDDSPTCGAGEVELTGQCFECESARRTIVDRMRTTISTNGWNACETNADCVGQEWSTPCDGQCPVAIATSAVEAFEEALEGFASSVCDPAVWTPTCGFPRNVDCAIAAVCVNGACRISTGGAVIPCSDRASDRCTEDGLCATSGAFPHDPDGRCFGSELVAVGCVDAELSCPPVITPALDTQGRCYSFGGCLPAGFTPAPEDHPCRADLAAVQCTE